MKKKRNPINCDVVIFNPWLDCIEEIEIAPPFLPLLFENVDDWIDKLKLRLSTKMLPPSREAKLLWKMEFDISIIPVDWEK